MSQHDLNIANQGFPAFRADLNDALVALGSTNSGATAPATTFANQLWYDTANNQLKQRNEDNDAWIVIAELNQSTDTLIAVGGKTLPAGSIVGTSDTQELTNKTINAGQLVDATVTPAKLSSTAQYTGFKNRVINGDMRIDQRNNGASATPTTLNNVFSVDRWVGIASQSTKYTFQQNAGSVTPPAGFTNYLGITSSSSFSVASGDYFFVEHDIEGLNCADLAWGTASAKTVTLSFWARSSLTGTFAGSLRNSAGGRSYLFSYTINSANTWEYKTITIVGDTSGTWLTNNSVGIRISFNIGSGADFSGTAGAWENSNKWSVSGAVSLVGTNGATLYLTGVQLEVGSSATSWDARSYGTELQLCQRYYQTCGTWSGNANNSTLWLGVFSWGVKMRANPTLGVTGAIAISDFRTADPVQSSAAMGAVLGYSENSACAFLGNYTGLRNDVFYGGNRTVNSNYITLSAEL